MGKVMRLVKDMYKGSSAKSVKGFHRPEGAGNFDNMDDYNIVNSLSCNEFKVLNVFHAHGGFQDVDYTLPLADNTWTIISNLTNTLWEGIESNGMTLINDQMIIANKGDYIGSLTLTFSALNGKDYQIRLYNITQDKIMGYNIGATTTGETNFTNITLPIYIEANAGDILEMQMRCTTDGTDPILRSAVFFLSYLHE